MPYTPRGLWYPSPSSAPNAQLDMSLLAQSVNDRIPVAGASGVGVYDASNFEVRQRQLGATMSVDILPGTASPVAGIMLANGSDFPVYCPISILGGANLNLVVGANASGNPRIDQVIATWDSTAGTIVFSILAGTATAAATLDNRNGAATPASNQTRLADILVANGAGSITNSVIRDRRKWARGAFAVSGDTTGHTIASSTFAIITAKTLRLDLQHIQPQGSTVKITVYGQVAGTATKSIGYGLFINGNDMSVAIDARYKCVFVLGAASANTPFFIEWTVKDWITSGLAATTSNLFQIAHQSIDNTTTLTSTIFGFKVEESVRPAQVNNPTTTG